MMSSSPNTVIGHIIDVQGDLLVATLVEDDQGRAPIVTIGDEDVLVGQLGSYVAVKQNDVNLIAIVTRMTENRRLLPHRPSIPPGTMPRDCHSPSELRD